MPLVRRYLIHRWFLLTLMILLVSGIWFSDMLEPLAEIRELRYGVVAAVLFLMALPLQASVMGRTVWPPLAPGLGVAVNYGLLPMFAWVIARGLGWINGDLAAGLLVAAATPCTLASAAVWTRRAGGNDAVAMLVTVLTNLSCFIVTPLWIFSLTGARTSSLSMTAMIGQLAYLVVLPIFGAQLLRLYGPIGTWATRQKVPLGVLAQCGILAMIFIGSIQTGQRLFGSGAETPGWLDLLWMVAAVMTVHLGMLSAGWSLAGLVGLGRPERIAVAFSGSQKTLMIGLQVAMECNITILPMVTYHVGQLFVDTLIADRLRQRGDEAERLAAADVPD